MIPAALDPARLLRLYEISKILIEFESVEQTVPSMLAALHETLPLRSSVLLRAKEGPPEIFVWSARAESESTLEAITAHGLRSFSYLTRASNGLRQPPDHRFVTMPLVVARGPIFGALQLEGAPAFDELDLMFANAVAGELAVAMDRKSRIEARLASAAAALEKHRFMSNASEILSSSLDYQGTLTVAARLAVESLADYCVIDIFDDDQIRRVAVAARSPEKPQVNEVLKALRPTFSRAVLATRASELWSELPPDFVESIGEDRRHHEILGQLNPVSLMAVPLVSRRRLLGAICFISSGHRYRPEDLRVAEELGNRAALAIEHAREFRQAQDNIRLRDDLLANVSHDLRNPLATIQLSLDVLAQDPGHTDRCVEQIRSSVQYMSLLVRDLLDSASITSGHFEVERKPVEVRQLIKDAIDAFELSASNRSLRLLSELPREPCTVLADPVRCHQVLANLIGNAIKFTPSGGSVVVRAEPVQAIVRFSVRDTGPGIAKQELSHLFDRFWQGRPADRRGAGLGLFIAKEIVAAHGGNVWVESDVGRGSAFFFTLPMAHI